MADSKKGNSTAGSKKKIAALDEDFGKDFLSFWGSSKKGKDKMDFDMEDIPRNNKKFTFDKLDDFELGGDFDKLPSFKMDMPDLDFTSPVVKGEKPTEKSIGKQESKQEKFSFNFDFNELDRFDLDSSPVKGEKKPQKHAESNASDYPFKHVRDQDSRSNSDTSTDVLKDMENKKPLNADSMTTSKPENLMEDSIAKDSRPSVSQDLGHHDLSHEVQTSTVKQIAVAEEHKNDTHSNEGHREQPKETCFPRTTTEKSTQDFILQSVSGDSSQKDNPQFVVESASSDDVKTNSARERDDSMKTLQCSQSRNNRPANSYDTECCSETRMIESPNASSDFQKHCKWNHNEVTGGDVLNESTQGQLDIQNVSFTDFSQDLSNGMNNAGDKQKSGSKSIPSPLRRDSRAVNPKSLNEKVAAAVQLNSLNKSSDNASRKTSSATKNQLDSIHNNKFKTLNMYPVSENGKSKQNHEQAETWKVGISKSYGEGSTKGISDTSRSERDNEQSDISRFQLKTSNLQQQTTATNTAQLSHNLVSSTASIRCSKIVPVEMSDTSLKDKRACATRLSISSITKLNSNTLNSATPKEAKSVRFSESTLEFPLNTASKMASAALTEKSGSINSFLKRKPFQESTANPENLKPLKRAMESVTGRKPFEVSQKVERAAVPVIENLEAACNDNYTEDLASNGAPKLEGLRDIEVPLLIDKDGIVEKTKELDDTSSVKQITVEEENRNETRLGEGHREQTKGTCWTKLYSERATSASAREQDDSTRSVDSSQSRNTSPEHRQSNQNGISGGKEVLSESYQYQMQTLNASFMDFSKKIAHRTQNASKSKNVHTEIIPSPLQSFKHKTSGLQQQTIGSNTAENINPDAVLSIAAMKSSRIPIKMNGFSPKNVKTFDSELTISSITNLNSKMQNSATTKEAKSARFSNDNLEFPLKTASKMANSITEKSAFIAAPLKRKTFEDSTDDPKNSNPLKRVMESPIGRKQLEVSPKTERAMVPVTENLEGAEDLNSNGFPELGGSASIEVLAPMEKDEIVEKAEAYAKQLDDMCDMLRKKHEEAHELLVRAVVNNNSLLMLNHPLFEEKIRSLQSFATSLQSKKFF